MKFAQLIGKELELDNPFLFEEPERELLVLSEGGKGGGGGNTTTVEKADPWVGQQPYLKKGFSEAGRIYGMGGPQFYPDPTYVPFSDASMQGLNLLENSAYSPTADAAVNQTVDTLSGNYLNNNPYIDQMFDQGSNDIMAKVNANFSSAGRTGSGAHQGVMADELGDLYTNLYGANYQSERDNQVKMAALAPQSASMELTDVNRLLSAGGAYEDKYGQILADDMNRFNHYQNLPQQNLQNYIAAIQGNYGGSSTSSVDGPGSNPISGAVGGGLAGAALGGMFTEGGLSALGVSGAMPWMLGGAALGLLAS